MTNCTFLQKRQMKNINKKILLCKISIIRFTQINHLEGKIHTHPKKKHAHTVSKLLFEHVLKVDNTWKVPISLHRLHNVRLDWKNVDYCSVCATIGRANFTYIDKTYASHSLGSEINSRRTKKKAGRQQGRRCSTKLCSPWKYPWLVQRRPGAI